MTVTGTGRGGRNQEFVAGAIDVLSRERQPMLLSSVGTDGIDGPTDAAGAWADNDTAAIAASQRLSIGTLLADNDVYELHKRLGTLIRTGPTDTNVGDLQVALDLLTRPCRPSSSGLQAYLRSDSSVATRGRRPSRHRRRPFSEAVKAQASCGRPPPAGSRR